MVSTKGVWEFELQMQSANTGSLVCVSVCLSLQSAVAIQKLDELQHMDMKSSTNTGLSLPGVGSRPGQPQSEGIDSK